MIGQVATAQANLYVHIRVCKRDGQYQACVLTRSEPLNSKMFVFSIFLFIFVHILWFWSESCVRLLVIGGMAITVAVVAATKIFLIDMLAQPANICSWSQHDLSVSIISFFVFRFKMQYHRHPFKSRLYQKSTSKYRRFFSCENFNLNFMLSVLNFINYKGQTEKKLL